MSGTGAGPLEGPLQIQSTWPTLPDVIDAAFQDPLTKKLFFFSGEPPPLQDLRIPPCLCPCWEARKGPWSRLLCLSSVPCSATHPLLLLAGQRFWVSQGPRVAGPRSLDKLGIGRDVRKIVGSLTRKQGKVLLFGGDQFWRYRGGEQNMGPLCPTPFLWEAKAG